MIRRKIKEYIERNKLFEQKDKLLVALSGGADSVALLYLLVDLGYSCEAMHCNFQLRGDESERDQQFVVDLCRQLNVPLYLKRFETTQYAQLHRISIEMAARDLRYGWFESVRQETAARFIAVAHHKDDQAETVLLNLIRGTGIGGLVGMRPVNGFIVRPMLDCSRTEIISYLESNAFNYVVDSTNLQDDYTRNKLRIHLLPMLAEINPSIADTLCRNAEHMADAYAIYQQGIAEGIERVVMDRGISIVNLKNEPSPRALLHEILSPKGFNSSTIAEIVACLDAQSGKMFYGLDGWVLIKDREYLLLSQKSENDEPPFMLTVKQVQMDETFQVIKSKNVACLDVDKLTSEPYLRKWQAGDCFQPFGMKGRKLVSDYMTDRKFSRLQKDAQWVLCCEIGRAHV